MTDDVNTPGEPYDWDNDPDGLTLGDVDPHDWMLEGVFDFVLGMDEELGINNMSLVLSVGGSLVSGTVVTRRVWLAEVIASLPPTATGLGEFLDSFAGAIWDGVDTTNADRRAAGRPTRPRKFIHLRDVEIAAGPNRTTVAHWRGAVDRIDGWSLGSYSYT